MHRVRGDDVERYGAVMQVTIKQAGRATGKSKATILRAIQGHRLSAAKDDVTGAWMIDMAELHRVFPAASSDAAEAVQEADEAASVMRAEVGMMRERLEDERRERERERTEKEAVIADLREDRDRWRFQAEKLLLTDQRPGKRRRWFWRRRGEGPST
jgi:hypothetical protein